MAQVSCSANDAERINGLAECLYNRDETKRGFVTVLVGAGASMSSPTKDLREALKETLGEDVFETNARVHFGKRYHECTLEELFSIYAKIRGGDAVRTFLMQPPKTMHVKIVRDKQPIRPNVGYEFLAHLVHHKLIDNVITTNFDEELEISLNDEIGRENYTLIRSLSEFDAFNREIEREEQESSSSSVSTKPILLKVHGTISYPITMRPTIEKVRKFEKRKLKLIKRMLLDTNVFIIAGYSFRDTDFRNVFFEALQERSDSLEPMKVYWIDLYWNPNEASEISETLEAMKSMPNRKILPQEPFPIGSDMLFEKLADAIQDLDRNDKRVPKILRHKIRNLILKEVGEEKVNEAKFQLEVIIFAVKAKGLFGVDALSDCIRIQRHYKELIDKNIPFLHNVLNELKDIGIISPVYSERGIYCIPASKDDEMGHVAEGILRLFDVEGRLNSKKGILQDLLKKLKEDFDVDIAEPEAGVYFMFSKPVPIKNHSEWNTRTKQLLKEAKKLDVIAQTGEWIWKNQELFSDFLKKGRIRLIVCEKFLQAGAHTKRQDDVETKLKQMANSQGQLVIKYLPWEDLSEHIKLNDENRKQGIYMKRIAKSPTVSPVWVEGQDYSALQAKFEYYWQKARA
jgi:hypothetical protein